MATAEIPDLFVAIVGLGRIGSSYGEDIDGNSRSHVGAVFATEGLAIGGLFDPLPAAVLAARATWPLDGTVVAGNDLNELAVGAADIIALCTPPKGRLALVRTALEKKPKVLIVEKPLASNIKEGKEIVWLAREADVALRINFHRALDPAYRKIRRDIADKVPKAVLARYSGGLFNYASHLIDNMLDWFGDISSVTSVSRGDGHDDPQVSFVCDMKAGFQAIIIAIGDISYDQFECDLFFADERIELANGGVEKFNFTPQDDLYYPGYRQLKKTCADVRIVGGLRELYENSRRFILAGDELAGCGGARALRGLEVLEAVRNSVKMGGVTQHL